MKILLVGCGAMGNAFRQKWLDQPTIHLKTIDPSMQEEAIYPTLFALPTDFKPHIIVFAVKPQLAAEVVPLYSGFMTHNPLVISIMAGISIASLTLYLGSNSIIVRAMPNLPVMVQQGMTGIYTDSTLAPQQRHDIDTLFSTVGKRMWVDTEEQLDVITAISGSGPAYFFRFVECLAKAAFDLGLPLDNALLLAQQTLVGAGELIGNSAKGVTELKMNVTSPGGTTAAALAAFDIEDRLETVVKAAVQAAFLRAQELSQ